MFEELRIPEKQLVLIQEELEINKPYEACGVIVGTLNGNAIQVKKILPVMNVKRTRRSFELDPAQFYNAWNDAERNGMEIVGIYHTHPSSLAIPSLWDIETMENDSLVWLIAGVDGIKAYVWDDGVRSVDVTVII